MTVCVNLGSGGIIAQAREHGQFWVNLDRVNSGGVQILADLEEGLPFKDESVDLLHASHVVEHIRKFPELMQECHRVLKPRGVLILKTPVAGCRAAYGDPTHCQRIVPETWEFFNKDSKKENFDTLGMQGMGLILKWNEVVKWRRNGLDDGVPGTYFTESIAEYEKEGPLHEWESKLVEMVKNAESSDSHSGDDL